MIHQVAAEICRRNDAIRDFWGSAHGWASDDAADLLAKSRLDRKVALSHCLSLWTPDSLPAECLEGALILGWANLGALVEGTLKWFLSVYHDQVPDGTIPCFRETIGPEEAILDQLRLFYAKHYVWYNEAERLAWDPWLVEIRDRRNAVHAYMDRDISTFEDLNLAIERYLALIDTLEGRVPYP